ncbi:MAG: hypothetical protein U5J99_01235 [Parvularculaceae bacterium]|nr:hypothetical protein [Parvularculaceae bacterium]
MDCRTLRADLVIETIDRLERRIAARFPEAGLRRVCADLSAAARQLAAEAERLNRPQRWIRVGAWAVVAAGAGALGLIAASLHYDGVDLDAASFIQLLEPAMNLAVLVGIGLVGLSQAEMRWKRGRALSYLHSLRSIIHVVDMHQLTKDPYALGDHLPLTEHSPKRILPAPLLERYLDYCSEMAALAGKLAALLAQSCTDPGVVGAAGDVEALTASLTRNCWQKIALIARVAPRPASAAWTAE